jgi:hypothetical protein
MQQSKNLENKAANFSIEKLDPDKIAIDGSLLLFLLNAFLYIYVPRQTKG